MQNLFQKYLDNQCSPAEVRELLAHFDLPENELLLRAIIAETLEKIDAEDDGSTWQPATEKIFKTIKNQVEAEKIKSLPFYRKNWLKVAAALILLVGAYLVYNQSKNTNEATPQTADSNGQQGNVLPGHNKATLTTADGSIINLENSANGNIAQQGSVKIIKSEDGQLSYTGLNEKSAAVLLNTVITPRGGQYQVSLSDGSKVWLNAESSIEFPVAFTGEARKVKITGEVYFEIAKNPSMPFTVNVANKADVEVLGTHFNVNAYSDEANVSTTLLEGSVKVTSLVKENSEVITPGQQAIINANGQLNINKQVDMEQVTAWKNGVFNFNDANLETVLKQVSRWYDVDILYEGPIPQRSFDGEIQRGLNLSQVLKLLEKNDVHFKLEGKRLIVLK